MFRFVSGNGEAVEVVGMKAVEVALMAERRDNGPGVRGSSMTSGRRVERQRG